MQTLNQLLDEEHWPGLGTSESSEEYTRPWQFQINIMRFTIQLKIQW